MEIFIVLLVIASLISIFRISNLNVKVENLKRKIEKIENSSGVLQKEFVSNVYPIPNIASSAEDLTQSNANISENNEVYDEVYNDKVLAWIKENWLLKLGVLLILVGFGWFVSYAFVHNWIGPVGRISLGLFVGTILAIVGSMRMSKNIVQGNLFIVLGSGLIIITSLASQLIYNFFDRFVTLGIVFLVSLFVTTIALQFNNRNLAIYSIVIAFMAPLLTHGPQMEMFPLFSYLAVIIIGSAWVAINKNWDILNAVSIVGFCLYCLSVVGYSQIDSLEKIFVVAIVYAIAALYFVISTVGFIKNKVIGDGSDILVAVFNSALIIWITLFLVPKELQSLCLAGWMLIFAAGSYVVFVKTQKESFFYIYSLISVVLLAIATSVELDGPSLILAYAFESAIISIAGYLITKKISVGQTLSLLMFGPAMLSLGNIFSTSWETGIYHRDFLILAVLAILFFALGVFYYISKNETDVDSGVMPLRFYIVLNILGSAYVIVLIWLSSKSLLTTAGEAVMVSLVIYTVIGLAAYFYGLFNKSKVFKYYGATLLILVVLRLVIIDVWSMALAERIITFIVVGLMFISTAFISNKLDKGTAINNVMK